MGPACPDSCACLGVPDPVSGAARTVSASSPGAWASDFSVRIAFRPAPDQTRFTLDVIQPSANNAVLENINILLMLAGLISFVEILQVKYLNNLIEQDHRFIKKITNPMMGFKAFHSAKATIDGIETAHMIRKGQLSDENIPAYKQFMALAG